jgi:hypothetical protein
MGLKRKGEAEKKRGKETERRKPENELFTGYLDNDTSFLPFQK